MSSFSDLPRLLPFYLSYFSLEQLQKTVAHFGSLEQALKASQSDWLQTGIATPKQLQTLFDSGLEKQIEQTQAWGDQPEQTLLPIGAEAYPALLKQIADPPPLLSVRGCVELLSDPQLSVVGSRHASRQGISTALDFAEVLSSQGMGIVSGLALGIDAAAHEGGLKGMGKTVAVVATGLDRIYPAKNKALAHRIVDEGAMISEFPLGTKPLNYHFPRRNRIISGLSVGTLVVEAAVKSGSLITARTALEQDREVFAVPGSIHNPQAKGCHQLIRQGAKLVESGQDVLEELAYVIDFPTDAQTTLFDSPRSGEQEKAQAERGLLRFIEFDPVSLDELVVMSKLPVSDIQSQLMLLELSGEVEALSAGRWRRLK